MIDYGNRLVSRIRAHLALNCIKKYRSGERKNVRRVWVTTPARRRDIPSQFSILFLNIKPLI